MLFVSNKEFKPLDRDFVGPQNLGDLIYSLPYVRFTGGGNYFVVPRGKYAKRIAFNQSLVEYLASLPYIGLSHLPPIKREVNSHKKRIRCAWLNAYAPVAKRNKSLNLIKCHFKAADIPPPHKVDQWLHGEKIGDYPIVFNKTLRYSDRRRPDYRFLNNRNDVYFVGTIKEYERARSYHKNIKYLKTPTIQSLINTIYSCKVYIGNQSAPLSIAVGLGKNRLIEECDWFPNCTFGDFCNGEEIVLKEFQYNQHHLDRLLKA